MYLKSIALIVAIYGRGALAALKDSCEEGDTTCTDCTPLNTEYEPAGVGEVWYSTCCTESETSTASPPTGDPYTPLAALNPDPGCPGDYDSNTEYEAGDTVSDNDVVYACTGAVQFCNLYAPDLKGVGGSYWTATASCDGTASPTANPTWATGNIQDGCPEEYDSSATYEANEQVAVTRDDGVSIMYQCKPFPESQWCNDDTYSPLSTEKLCNGETCWSRAWNKLGACDGTFSPTATPTFDPANLDGCPEEYDAGTDYEPGDKVSVTPAGEDYGKIYQCKSWPNGGNCVKESYSPANTDKGCNGEVCWPEAWTYVGGCTGTIAPTSTPTFDPADLGGCPEEYEAGTDYEPDDKVSVTPAGEDYGKIYKCKGWPEGGNCVKEAYSPANTEKGCNGEVCWPGAWTYIGGCTGTIAPTSTPTFDPADLGGCPEEYEAGTDYEEGDTMSITPAGEDYGKIYKCKGWPFTKYCMQEVYSPANTEKGCNGKVCWPEAWTYVGGCYGTIAPTLSPVFNPAKIWDLEGCPDEYVPNSAYEGGDYVSVPKGEGTTAANTAGVVWKCKEGNTNAWCQQEVYAPGGQYAESAWEKVGFCEGTIAPTDAPIAFTGECQFKYKLETSEGGEYVVLQAESWVKGGTSVSTGTGGTPLDLYKAGNLVRYGSDARKCSGWPFTPFCDQFSPFTSDEANYNPTHSKQGWSAVACEDIVSDTDDANNKGLDTFVPATLGPVFASNGDVLVDYNGVCFSKVGYHYYPSGGTNPEDYFKPSPAVKGCRQCPTSADYGFNCPIGAKENDGTTDCHPDLCTTCRDGTTSKIVDRESQCVCDNGATDPWDALGSQCQKCADGKKYLGAVVNNDGDGVCDECPSAYPYYTTYTDDATLTFKLCCEEPGCSTAITAQDGTGCYDGTTSNTVCSGDVTWV
eukprot:scaffold565_cov143-Skeletonema_menzelii.AAC.3